jgi:tRNA-dihydrouridine synthase 3
VARIVAAMRAAIDPIPVTVKIRLGWNDRSRNYLELAKAAVDAGAAAVTVHGRTRDARYRHAAEWDVIGEIAAALPVPVIGNGDLLFGHEIAAALERSGCAAVMVARGALIRPWLFREIRDGYHPLTAGDRLAIYRRYVELALAHWGGDEHGRTRVREFLLWHLGFWCREAPQRPDGSWPTMQGREPFGEDLLPIEQLLRRSDAAAHEWLADRLMGNDDDVDPRKAPAPQETEARGAELEAHG